MHNLTLNRLHPVSQITAYAQEWADHLSANNLLVYRDNEDGMGENIFLSPMAASSKEVCADWYEEGNDYPDFTAEPDMGKSSSKPSF